MKKSLTLLFLAITFQVVAQTYPITGINISLPANPDANTANWGSGSSLFTITSTTKAENGRVAPHVMESKILVTIKKGGTKACGSYTGNTAPGSNFNTLTKVWGGINAVALLGQDCVLTPGDYELCVQFFGYGPVGMAPLSEEKCKPFSIREKEQQTFQPPQSIAPVDGTVMSEADAKKPITFRWIPVIPRPQDPVTYRLTVWQLMQGQTGTQAMKANQPIITKDVDNITQAVINNLVSGPCLPPYLCSFIWNVQALNHEGKPIGENNGTSKPSQFSASSCDVNLTLKLKSVECLSTTNGNNNYKICLSATYISPNYNLTYSAAGSGFKAYPPSFSPFYTVSNITPALQVQNSGSATTVNYCINVSVPIGQTSIKIGLQGDDKDPGPIVCQPGAELDFRLPGCPATCDCGTWGPILINRVKYDCGGRMEWKCNQPIYFSNTYLCSPNNESCQAKTNWEITRDGSPVQSQEGSSGSFTPTSNGTYTITLHANCNGKDCPICTYTFVVQDCRCDCGSWGPILINKVKYDCGGKMEWKCNQPINFTNTYQCTPNDESCQARTKWKVTRDGSDQFSGSGTGGSFTPTTNGVYTLTLYANCNGKDCPTCTYTFVVQDCRCDCGTWGPILINKVKYDCGGKMEWKCNQPINFTNTYQCTPNDESCQARTKWKVTRDGSDQFSGSGTGGSFTPTTNGVYTLTLYANCNGKDCPTCTYTFVVQDCRCDCGTWGTLVVLQASGTKTYPCGIKMLIPGSCKQPFNFSDSYQCNPGNNPNCVANTTWKVEKGSIISSGTGNNNLNGSFTPTENGIYTITLNATCNGKICNPCIYSVVVNDCCPPREIIIYKKKIPIPNDGSCIEPGTYNFVLTPTTPVVTGTYTLVSTPSLPPYIPISTGPFNSSVPLTLTIPPYICGVVTGFKLTYSWNDGKCTSTIERPICVPPCCDNISVTSTNMSLTDTYLDFATGFSVSPAEIFTQVKVQILEVSVSGVARPNANILSINKSPAIPPWPAGNTNLAITTLGNAWWFSGSLSASGTLTFNGIIINILPPATTNSVKLILRYTFYKNNGSCTAVICEKDVTYYIGDGPRNPIK